MRFASLGSGSKGNAWLVESGNTRVMIDCGFAARETTLRLQRLGLEPEQIDAIAITHEHSDHVRGAAGFSARSGARVLMTHGTFAVAGANAAFGPVSLIDISEPIQVGDLALQAYTVPHDAREPVQYVVSDGAHRFALLTDAGHITEHMVSMLQGCEAIAIECNHDVGMLQRGAYPPALKSRILGRYGHLDNGVAAGLLGRVAHGRLQHVVAAHLSEENNTPRLAQAALAASLGCAEDWIAVADQQTGVEWRQIS
jgi:phosphoribosyl 1,2-cyclic phosphodiesterase